MTVTVKILHFSRKKASWKERLGEDWNLQRDDDSRKVETRAESAIWVYTSLGNLGLVICGAGSGKLTQGTCRFTLLSHLKHWLQILCGVINHTASYINFGSFGISIGSCKWKFRPLCFNVDVVHCGNGQIRLKLFPKQEDCAFTSLSLELISGHHCWRTWENCFTLFASVTGKRGKLVCLLWAEKHLLWLIRKTNCVVRKQLWIYRPGGFSSLLSNQPGWKPTSLEIRQKNCFTSVLAFATVSVCEEIIFCTCHDELTTAQHKKYIYLPISIALTKKDLSVLMKEILSHPRPFWQKENAWFGAFFPRASINTGIRMCFTVFSFRAVLSFCLVVEFSFWTQMFSCTM